MGKLLQILASVLRSAPKATRAVASRVSSGAKRVAAFGRKGLSRSSAVKRAAGGASTSASAIPVRDSVLEKLFAFQVASQALEAITGMIGRNLPSYAHSIMVAARGGPGATINDVWRLVLSTAFGRYRNRVRQINTGAEIDCTWDITNKACAIKITYASSAAFGARDGAKNTPHDPLYFVSIGPTEETVGSGWPAWLYRDPKANDHGNLNALNAGGVPVQQGNIPALPVGAEAILRRKFPNGDLLVFNPGKPLPINRPVVKNFDPLVDEGRLITTRIKSNPQVQPPQPPADADLVALVANALLDPCYLPAYPPDAVQAAQPTNGQKFFNPGATEPTNLNFQLLQNVAVSEDPKDVFPDALPGRIIKTSSQSQDGYPRYDPLANPPPDVRETPNAGNS